jgi:putative peptide zinc metalloprotease protein
MWFILPVGSCLHWLATNPGVQDRRGRVWGVTGAALITAILLIGIVPWPDHRRADGVVESEGLSGVFCEVEGFLDEVHTRAGTRVKKGDAILSILNPELRAQLRLAHAELSEAVVREQDATTKAPGSAQVAREYVAAYEQQIAYLESRVEKLVVRAPRDGVVVGPDLAQRAGLFIREGDALCDVVDEDDLRVVAVLSQDQADWISTLPPDRYRVELRRASRIRDVIPASLTRAPSAARRELPHAALGHTGGGAIETRQGQVEQGEQVAKRPVFRASFAALADAEGASASVGVPGERVKLRFTLPSRPLLFQWIDRVEQTVQGRARV